MTDITVRSDFEVELIDYMGSDFSIVRAARVSTKGEQAAALVALLELGEVGLIRRLMRDRHGSCFEHCVLTFRVRAPIFVWREFMRHRMASYNEESGRYRQLDPEFYVPPRHRPLEQVPGTKQMDYALQPTNDREYDSLVAAQTEAFQHAYATYEAALERGIVKESARTVLPVAIYSSAYVTMNLRGLMNFLSLRVRTDSNLSMFPSNPQWEINQVASEMEAIFKDHFPVTWAAFTESKRVCP